MPITWGIDGGTTRAVLAEGPDALGPEWELDAKGLASGGDRGVENIFFLDLDALELAARRWARALVAMARRR